MSQSEQDHPRYEWLDQAKRLCRLLVRRDAFFDEACPKYGLSAEEEEEALAKISKASKEVEGICGRLAQIESETKVAVGARALLGDMPIPQHLVSVIALLSISRLSSDAAALLRGHERTGRPLGSAGFVSRLEEVLGRVLAPR